MLPNNYLANHSKLIVISTILHYLSVKENYRVSPVLFLSPTVDKLFVFV